MIYRLGDYSPEISDDQTWIAPSADVMGRVRLRARASIWFGAVLRGDNEWIDIGEGSNIQDLSVLHTDPGCPLTIGEEVTVGHKVMLHGCTIADRVLVGMGATIMNRARIGENSIIGAGSLITEGKDFPPNSLILGAPARVAKTLDDTVVEQIKLSADIYKANAVRFREELTVV